MDRILARAIRTGLVIILIGVPLIYSSHLQDSFSVPKKAFFQTSVALLLIIFAIRCLLKPDLPGSAKTPLDWLIAGWLAWFAVSALFSLDRAASLRELTYIASLAGLFLLVTRNVESRRHARALIVTIAAVGVLEAAYGIAERMGIKLLYEAKVIEAMKPVVEGGVAVFKAAAGSRGSVLGTFGNANHLATYLVITIPLILAGIALGGRAVRFLAVASCAVVVACLILTGARAAWFAVLLSSSAFLIYWLWRDSRSGVRFIGYAAALLASLVIVVFLTEPRIAREFTSRVSDAFTDVTGSRNIRLIAWRLTPRMVSARPIVGSGPDSYRFMFLPSLADYLRGGDPLGIWFINEKMNEAHNEYFQLAVETGLPGLALFGAIVAVALGAGWKALRAAGPTRGFTAAALGAAVAGVLADALFSIPFHVVPTYVALWAVLALLFSPVAAPEREAVARPSSRRIRMIAPAIGLIFFAGAAIGVSAREVLFSACFKAATALNHLERYGEAIPFFRQALAIRPDSGRLKFYYGSTLIQLGRYEEGAAQLEESKRTFQDIYLYKNLGLAYERLGRIEDAVEQYGRWREMGIGAHEANNMIALIRMRQGRLAEAKKLFRETLRVRPWDWTAYMTLGTLQLDSGEIDEALRTLKPDTFWKNSDAYALYGVALLRARRYAEAEKNLLHSLSLNPRSVRAHNNLGALYYATGRLEEAMSEWETSLGLDPENAIATRNLETARRAALKKATGEADPTALD